VISMDRATWLSPLGFQRLRLLDCLGGNNSRAPGHFVAEGDADVFSAFRGYAQRLSHQWAAETDPLTLSLLAAARLLTGDLSAAGAILDHLPSKATRLDHGAGFCLVVPLQALSAVLPLPRELADTTRWLLGSPEEGAIRAWLSDHGNDLRWMEADGVYRIVTAAGT
jgi:hypothetical protein